ncbi:MAG: hypothetical protein OQK79_09380, partial [Rhodanobacter sp.]|nr:hypothetical protein [Rhodanobacter sp.]
MEAVQGDAGQIESGWARHAAVVRQCRRFRICSLDDLSGQVMVRLSMGKVNLTAFAVDTIFLG